MQVLGAICLVVYLGYYLLIPMVIYVLVLYWLSKIYMHPSASIKRLESVGKRTKILFTVHTPIP